MPYLYHLADLPLPLSNSSYSRTSTHRTIVIFALYITLSLLHLQHYFTLLSIPRPPVLFKHFLHMGHFVFFTFSSQFLMQSSLFSRFLLLLVQLNFSLDLPCFQFLVFLFFKNIYLIWIFLTCLFQMLLSYTRILTPLSLPPSTIATIFFSDSLFILISFTIFLHFLYLDLSVSFTFPASIHSTLLFSFLRISLPRPYFL